LPELLLLSWESCYSCLDDLCVFYTEKTEAKRYKSPPSRLSGSPLPRPSKSSVLLTSESSTWVCGRQQCHSSYWQLGRHRFVTIVQLTCAVKAKIQFCNTRHRLAASPAAEDSSQLYPIRNPFASQKNLSRFYWRKMLRRARMEGIPDQA
jgi:hypothetical protein